MVGNMIATLNSSFYSSSPPDLLEIRRQLLFRVNMSANPIIFPFEVFLIPGLLPFLSFLLASP